MNKTYIKKSLAVVVILLFISVSVVPSTGTNVVEKTSNVSFDGNTLYVGGSGPNNYTKIQDAIDDASDGDTVYVYNGTYYENVVVDKSINLIGEDRNTTIVAGSYTDDVISLMADKVCISGFKIKNSGDWPSGGIHIQSSNNTISYNNISDNYNGIWVAHSRNYITNNYITSNKYSGIHYSYNRQCEDNIISNNLISNTRFGIYLMFNTRNNTIFNNIITLCRDDGITLDESINNTVSYNQIFKNNCGIWLDWFSVNNTISRNLILDNKNGIVMVTYCEDNIIKKNNILENINGIQVSDSSCNNTFVLNNIKNNIQGLFLLDSSNNTIISNNFRSNLRNAAFLNCKNSWNLNYWNIPRIFPKIIFGKIGYFPWINFDWNPAQEPYDIPGCEIE